MSAYKDKEINLQEALDTYKQLEKASEAPQLHAQAYRCQVDYKPLLARYNRIPFQLDDSNAQTILYPTQKLATLHLMKPVFVNIKQK